MKKFFRTFLFLAVFFSAVHADDMYPNIAVVNTNDDGLIGVIEKSAAQRFYMNYPDIYDFVFVYTTFTPSMNMQQGIPIQYTVQGINRDTGIMNPYGTPADWGSFGKLLGAARMCNLDQYPENPDVQISTGILNPYSGMSSVELLAHEWSHYWLSAMDFKKEGMTEPHTGLRGWEDGANQHWNADFMSGPSVMYGGDITDNGDGSFTYQYDNPKKYGPLDQYVMGFIPPEEVGELFFMCSSSDIEQCREGSAAVPANKTSPDSNKSGLTKHIVTIDDIIRAMGTRIPSSAEAPKHFNVAFILANKEGFYPFPQQLQKMETLRVRFQEWFTWATDGKATICTELDGDCTNGEEPDDDPVIDEDQPVDENVETPDETTETPDEAKDEEIQDDTEKTDDNEPAKDDISETTDDPKEDLIDDESVGCGCTIVF
ncbi:MAG TPA: hypothetical protein VLJ60_05595 [bacterium]|nr:hypothetical protein [bacterium]